MKHQALLAFGGNLATPADTFRSVMQELSASAEILVTTNSDFYQTEAIGGRPGQPLFLNAAIWIETSLSASQLIEHLLLIETRLGRTREQRWDARTVDLDIMLFDDLQSSRTNCRIPHPRMTFRRFMLEPAESIAADWHHPVCNRTIGQLLHQLNTRPAVCCLLGSATSWSQATRQTLHAITDNFGYTLVTVDRQDHQDQDSLEAAKLYLVEAPSSHPDGIPGPYLQIGGMTEQQLTVELEAALQAIASRPVRIVD